MDYTNILQELRSASLFDLFRLRAAIEQQLDNPERIDRVRARLRPGMSIRYFDETGNRLIDAVVVELNRTRLVVLNRDDGQQWSIRFCAVNLEGADTDLRPDATRPGLDRSQLRVGDRVGFRDRNQQERFGLVLALNQKTATVLASSGERWRVAYALLFRVLDIVDEETVVG